MLIGYGRTSTTDQDAGIEAQRRDLLAADCEKLFIEQVSSVGKRQQLEAAIEFAREGDTSRSIPARPSASSCWLSLGQLDNLKGR